MKFKEVLAMTPVDREKKLKESKMELLKLRAQVSQGTVLKSPGQVKQLKKLIAQISSVKEEGAK
ncbi:MAG: 50S ribosomal protein L29 [Candidatus Nanoarchaeia archaeon]|jgi:ribosomal protein L29|nr:50S ribosomal protein L29 [Candidatus Nanoarchaeia archaeon]